MDYRLQVITLAVRDVDVARAFYPDGNSWIVQEIGYQKG
jgi:hypothetical protein